ncbi:MAG: MerR family DNA-binding protein [Bryobacterales bacterium]|nr:MerR family DNA-binding protein [Bryobacterales bacterium]
MSRPDAVPPDAVRRIRSIKRAQELGFALAEVKELLALRVHKGAARMPGVGPVPRLRISKVKSAISFG